MARINGPLASFRFFIGRSGWANATTSRGQQDQQASHNPFIRGDRPQSGPLSSGQFYDVRLGGTKHSIRMGSCGAVRTAPAGMGGPNESYV
jgi:hypothetical protein